jgi:hypothetical protein
LAVSLDSTDVDEVRADATGGRRRDGGPDNSRKEPLRQGVRTGEGFAGAVTFSIVDFVRGVLRAGFFIVGVGSAASSPGVYKFLLGQNQFF